MRSKWLPRAAGFCCFGSQSAARRLLNIVWEVQGAQVRVGREPPGAADTALVVERRLELVWARLWWVSHCTHIRQNAARSQASDMIGCTQSEINGIRLKNENDEQIYMIISSGTPLQIGQPVELIGVVTDQGPGARTFRVQGPITSYGPCSATAAASTQTATARTP
jgi:hypothetical protein